MGIAFFDLDRTILDLNSGSAWIKSEYRGGHLGLLTLARASLWLARYHLGFADLEKVVRQAVAALEGVAEAEIADRTARFYHAEIAHRVRPGAYAALERHRAAGDRLVLLTTSSIYLSRLVGPDLGLDHWLCSHFEVDDAGLFTGQPVEPLCFGHGKLAHARAEAEAHGIALADCSFYTDSIADRSVLEVVAHPVVISPDPKLARLARKRGWRIDDWGCAP